MKYIDKIIVHNGEFHADDVILVALLIIAFPIINIERKSIILDDELNDSSILVGDVGRQFNVSLNNYDHHQDENLSSAVALYIKHNWKLYFDNQYEYINFYTTFIKFISNVDTGNVDFNSLKNIPSISTIVGSFNNIYSSQDDSFNKAVEVVLPIVKRQIELSKQSYINRLDWDDKISDNPFIAINDDIPIKNWRMFANETGVKLLVTKSIRDEGHYDIISYDSEQLKIPNFVTKYSGFVFLHNNQFMCVFNNQNDAIKVANDIINKN